MLTLNLIWKLRSVELVELGFNILSPSHHHITTCHLHPPTICDVISIISDVIAHKNFRK